MILTDIGLLLLFGEAGWDGGGYPGDDDFGRLILPAGPTLLLPAWSHITYREDGLVPTRVAGPAPNDLFVRWKPRAGATPMAPT